MKLFLAAEDIDDFLKMPEDEDNSFYMNVSESDLKKYPINRENSLGFQIIENSFPQPCFYS